MRNCIQLQLIQFLIARKGAVVTRDEIARVIYREREFDVSDEAIASLVYRARKRLAAMGGPSIITAKNNGFYIEAADGTADKTRGR